MQVPENRKTRVPDRNATAARRAAGNYTPPVECLRAWTTFASLAFSLVAAPAAAQDDCDRYPDWTDIGWFRSCAGERGNEWATQMLGGGEWMGGAALHTENPAIIQVLLQAGADPHRVDDEGRTSLHWGARNANPVVTAHLLAAGADPNALDNEGSTPLHYAAGGLLEEGATLRGVVARLVAAGADPRAARNDGRTPLHSALRNDAATDRDVISALIRAGGADHLTPLQLAAVQGDAVTVTSLLAEGGDPNTADTYGWNALHFAVPVADPEVVSTLLEAGADPNAVTIGGMTTLQLAVRERTRLAVLSALIEAGADPNLPDGQSWTPLHFAAYMKRDDPSVVLALLQAGADPSPASADDQAWTPLHLAAWQSDVPSVVLALLDGGADPTARDENGRRPVDFARANDAIVGSSAYPRLLVPGAAGRLVAGRTVTGYLQEGDGVNWPGLRYYDEWTYSAAVGQRVVITMDSEDVGPSLVVLRDDGTEVASDDGGRSARVEFRAPATGRYTILASNLFWEAPGRYTLRVEQPTGGEGADDDFSGIRSDRERLRVLPGNGNGPCREIHHGFAGGAE